MNNEDYCILLNCDNTWAVYHYARNAKWPNGHQRTNVWLRSQNSGTGYMNLQIIITEEQMLLYFDGSYDVPTTIMNAEGQTILVRKFAKEDLEKELFVLKL